MNTDIDQRMQWQPPARPEWVQRMNEEGRYMDIRAVVPLDEASLLAAATGNTGLSDFGADDWREPFQILIKAFDEEAELNLVGRLRTRSELLQLLEARLRIEDTYKRNPEIEDENIVEPIFVVGQGRSGTSYLTNVLAANPDNGALMHWEARFPCPPPETATSENDPRIDKAHALMTQWYRVTPTLTTMHEFGGNLPAECIEILALNFMSPSWLGAMGQAASYDVYMAKQDPMLAVRYHQRVLKLLQWKKPRQHWVLKDPVHIDRLATILKLYPDARFVWPHRDPVRALASVINTIGTVQWGRSDHPFKGGSYDFCTDPDISAQRLNAVIDQLESGAVPQGQMHHMLYKDLVTDTMATVEAMYQELGMPLSEAGRQGMARYLAEHPRDTRSPHRYSAGSEAAVARARKAYERYEAYFKVPRE